MPRDADSRTANVGTVGTNGLIIYLECGVYRARIFRSGTLRRKKKMLVSVRLGSVRLGFFLQRTVLRRKIPETNYIFSPNLRRVCLIRSLSTVDSTL